MKQHPISTFDVFSRSCLLFHTRHFERVSAYLLHTYWKESLLPDIPGEDLDVLARASTLHDIGKCALSEQIVGSSMELSPLEFEIMKQHTTLGAMMIELASPEQISDPVRSYAREIVLYHHERWDGGGYPAGLRGAEIPAHVQVVSLADVYDGLRTWRPYRSARSHTQTVDQILRGGCGAFDLQLLALFPALMDKANREIYGEGAS